MGRTLVGHSIIIQRHLGYPNQPTLAPLVPIDTAVADTLAFSPDRHCCGRYPGAFSPHCTVVADTLAPLVPIDTVVADTHPDLNSTSITYTSAFCFGMGRWLIMGGMPFQSSYSDEWAYDDGLYPMPLRCLFSLLHAVDSRGHGYSSFKGGSRPYL